MKIDARALGGKVMSKIKRIKPCETCANSLGCKVEFGGISCHYFPEWGSPAFDRIRDQAREAGKDQLRE